MRDISDVKQFLKKAYSQLPLDFALTEVRQAVNSAIQKVEQYEKKIDRRVETQRQNQQIEVTKGLSSPQIKTTIDIIDKMIAEEEKKISAITAKKGSANGPDDVQTLHD